MPVKKRKTIDDFPHFLVSEVRRNKSATNEEEYSLLGTIDRIPNVRDGRCYLLAGGQVLIALSGSLQIDHASGAAEFRTLEKSMPEVVGLNLMRLSAEHDPVHVWMVAEPRWKWSKEQFQAMDAVYRKVEDNKISIIDGEEVKEWIEVKPISGGPLSRFYPVFPSGRRTLPEPDPGGVIKGGWNHAHCELCKAHIEAGVPGYVDLGKHWVCEQCYGDYVVKHDLSFLDDD